MHHVSRVRNQTLEGSLLIFFHYGRNEEGGGVYTLTRSKFVFLTHWKPHSAERIYLTCSGLLPRNESRAGCVNIAQPASLKGMGSVKEKLNPDPGVGVGLCASFKGREGLKWTRHFTYHTVVPHTSKRHHCITGVPRPRWCCVFSCCASPMQQGQTGEGAMRMEEALLVPGG